MDLLLCLGVDPAHFLLRDVTDHIQVVRRQVDHHAHISDAGRERPQPPAADLEDASQLACVQVLFQRLHRRVEAHDVPHHQLPAQRVGLLDQILGLILSRGNRLFDQNVAAGLHRIQRHLMVELGRHRDCEHLRPRLFKQRAVIGVSDRMV